MRRRSVLLVGVALLSGCLVGPNYQRPPTPEYPEYREGTAPTDSARGEPPSAELVADLPWWELYRDSVLQQLITTALAQNKDRQVALARIEEARAAVGFSRANLYPFVDAVAGGTLDWTSGDDEAVVTGVVAGTVFWEADLFGRIRRSNEAAVNEYLATEYAYRGVTIALVAQVAELYLVLRDLDNRLAIAEATANARRGSAEIIAVRFEAGAISEVDVHQAEMQLAEAEAAVESFHRLRAQTENAISVLLGQPPMDIARGEDLVDQVFPPALPTGLPSEVLERRPDVLAAERELAAQTARIGVAEALKYPSFTMSADMGASFASITSAFVNVGANLFGPLFNSGQNQRRVESEVARTRQLLHAYEATVLNALREVEDAMVAVNRYQAEYEHWRRQVVAAQSAAELSWIRYEGGWTSYLEVLEVQRSLFAAELTASQVLQLRHTSMVQLYKALGGGWTPESPVEGDAPGS